MVPEQGTILGETLQLETAANRDFILDFEKGCVGRIADGEYALRQAIAFRLRTQSGVYAIYDEDYGLPGYSLAEGELPAVYVNIKNRIAATLCADERIRDVNNFVFSVRDGGVQICFDVQAADGILKGSVTI